MKFWEACNSLFGVIFLMMIGAGLALERTKTVKEPGASRAAVKETGDAGQAAGKLSAEQKWFLILMLLALVLRLWKFGAVPGGMNQDGAMAAVDAKALADHGTDRFGTFLPTHFKAWGYGQMSVLLSYCMVPFVKLFGLNAVTARLPMLIASMAGLAALYFIARRLLGVRGAQVTLTFAICNPWHFMQSRWALDCNLFPHVFLIGLLLLLKGMEGKRRWLCLSMACFGLCMYAYGIAFYTVPVFLLIMAIYLLVKKLLGLKEVLISVLVYFLVSWPIYLTMMINAFGWKTMKTFFCTMPYFEGSVRSRDILFLAEQPWQQFWKNLEALRTVYVKGDNLPWNTVQGFGVLPLCFLPFVFLGLYVLIKALKKEQDLKKKAGYVTILVFFLTGNLSGVITASVNVNRINFLHYSLLILAGMGICHAWKYVRKPALLIAPAYLIMSVTFLGTYFTSHAETLDYYYYQDFIEAVRFAGDPVMTGCERLVITPDTQYRGAVNVTEILTLFALDVDAEVFQGKVADENGLYYKEKYRYANAFPEEMDASRPVAYVFRSEDVDWSRMELQQGYVFQNFGGYLVAYPWKK